MSQEVVINEITALERKLSVLVKEYHSLKENLLLLQDENQQLKQVIDQKQQQVDQFQNKAKISKLVNTIGANENEAADLKRKLDEYIKELDKCIAHLSY
jgi:regulator of replication initiation timing